MAGTRVGAKGTQKVLVTGGQRWSSFLLRMQKRKLDNKTLDIIGRRLFEGETLPAGEIDKIVSKTHLFESIKARIATNDLATPALAPAGSPVLQFVRRNAIAFASITVLVVAAIGALSLLRPETTMVAVKEVKIPDAVPEVARPVFPPQETETGKLSAGRAINADFRVEKAIVSRPRERTVRPPVVDEAEVATFYPVGYTGDPAETAGGGRIIRVDLNRSSLFALGVSLPLENDEATVKADLLIGADGVTRAVRIVN